VSAVPSFSGSLSGGQAQTISEEDAKAIAKLLSDPSYFPMEFRAWIKNYIEQSDITFPASAITGIGGVSASGATNLPAGIIIIYAGSVFGPDVLPCNGASLDVNDYDKLYAAIGPSWGQVDATHFNIPDFRDRTLFMAGSIVGLAASDGLALGSRGGPHHHHAVALGTDSQGNHKHNAKSGVFAQSDGTQFVLMAGADYPTYRVASVGSTTDSVGSHSHSVQGDTGGGYGTDPSWAGVNFCITTGKGGG
jgi:microcystin-dependent protein